LTKKILPQNSLIFLLGNININKNSEVDPMIIRTYAKDQKMEYFEMSFLDDRDRIYQLFNHIAKKQPKITEAFQKMI